MIATDSLNFPFVSSQGCIRFDDNLSVFLWHYFKVYILPTVITRISACSPCSATPQTSDTAAQFHPSSKAVTENTSTKVCKALPSLQYLKGYSLVPSMNSFWVNMRTLPLKVPLVLVNRLQAGGRCAWEASLLNLTEWYTQPSVV